MPIQLIIFLTKNKIFASEINNNGQADTISINGNSDIKCEGKESVDELIECIFEAFSIDSFGDDHFDIVIVDCGGDKKFISYLNAKCEDAVKLNVISFEKLLPLLVWNKKQLASGEEVVVAFADACYKVACDDKKVVRFTGKARKGKENVTLELDDFGCLYYFNVENLQGGVVNTTDLQEKDNVIAKLEEENEKLVHALNEKEKALVASLATAKKAEKKIAELDAEIAQWEKDHPKISNYVEKMIKIMESCKQETAEYTYGHFYVKGTIPKQVLNHVIEEFTMKFGVKIERNNIVALYVHDPEIYSTDSLRRFLICRDFMCIEDYRVERGKKEMATKPIYWKDVLNITEFLADHFDSMDFHYYDGTKLRVTMPKHYSGNTLFQKLVPSLNILKNLVEDVE